MEQTFLHPAQQVACQEYLDAVNELEARIERLTGRIRDLVPAWSMAPPVEALQAMRGVPLIVDSALVAEVGDMRRFDSPRQLMSYLGLVPSEHSSGAKRHQGTITKAGSPLARRMLVEGAWTYRLPARVSAQMRPCLAGLPRGFATRPGRRKCASERDTDACRPQASGRKSSSPRSRARWWGSPGRLGAWSRRLWLSEPIEHCGRGEAAEQTRRLGEEVERSGEPSANTTGRLRTDPRR